VKIRYSIKVSLMEKHISPNGSEKYFMQPIMENKTQILVQTRMNEYSFSMASLAEKLLINMPVSLYCFSKG
jgi:hypothetical protein